MGTKLYVGNLNYNTNEASLREAFGANGREVVSVSIIMDRETGRSRGFAFVEMSTPEGARKRCKSSTDRSSTVACSGSTKRANARRVVRVAAAVALRVHSRRAPVVAVVDSAARRMVVVAIKVAVAVAAVDLALRVQAVSAEVRRVAASIAHREAVSIVRRVAVVRVRTSWRQGQEARRRRRGSQEASQAQQRRRRRVVATTSLT